MSSTFEKIEKISDQIYQTLKIKSGNTKIARLIFDCYPDDKDAPSDFDINKALTLLSNRPDIEFFGVIGRWRASEIRKLRDVEPGNQPTLSNAKYSVPDDRCHQISYDEEDGSLSVTRIENKNERRTLIYFRPDEIEEFQDNNDFSSYVMDIIKYDSDFIKANNA